MGSNLNHGAFQPPTVDQVNLVWRHVNKIGDQFGSEVAEALSTTLQAYQKICALVPYYPEGEAR